VRFGGRDLLLAGSIAVAVIGASFGAPRWLYTLAMILVACLPWFRPTETNLLWYAATLALPAPQTFAVVRVTVADFFMLPAVVSEALSALRHGARLPRSTIIRPFALLLLVFAMGTSVGYAQTGKLTGYVLFNKDAGLLFQILGSVVMIRYAQKRSDVIRLARWFVIGVSLSNAFALLAAAAALAGYENLAYLVGNSRLYGWMANPSITGGMLFAASIIELGLFAIPAAPGDHRTWRWANLWILGSSIALTLSRSAWASLAAASGTLFALQFVDVPRQNRRIPYLACVAVWVLLPLLVLGRVAVANVGIRVSPAGRAGELRTELVTKCMTNPSLDICADVQMSSDENQRASSNLQAANAPSGNAPQASPPSGSAPQASPSIVSPPGWAGPDAAMTNSRGLSDRLAIIFKAWEMYRAHWTSIFLGIGLGTFFATSAPIFGVPLIIHNTYAWFLFEFGPLGLLVLVWLWLQTTRNLFVAIHTPDDSRYLALGLLAAFAGLTIFCALNEGFYQRQLWLIFVLADRLRLLSGRSPVDA
jgi:hypothetical protein